MRNSIVTQGWKKLFGYNFKEFQNQPLQLIKGTMPKELNGVMFRNTSAFHPRTNFLDQNGHLFDGDGAILRVQFQQEMSHASYQFIKTPQFQQEQKANKYIYPNLGRLYSGNRFQRLWNATSAKNTGNTSVLQLPDGPLLALWEGGFPIAIQPKSLETFGPINLGRLTKDQTFSAHPKVCPKTKNIYNIGFSKGKNQILLVNETNTKGQIIKSGQWKVEEPVIAMCHDFVLAGKYIVVLLYPNFLDPFKDFLLGSKSFFECVKFKPEKGTQLIVFDRNTLEVVSKAKNDAFWVWHYSNGYVDDLTGNIIVDQVAYKDMSSFQGLSIKNLMKNDINLDGQFERMTIDPRSGKILQRQKLFNDYVDFPIINGADVGSKSTISYCVAAKSANDFGSGIVRYENDERKIRFFEEGVYSSESLFVQNPTKQKDKGWLLNVLYDGNQDKSLIEISDSQTLDSICTASIAENVATSFHGTFVPQ